MSFRSSLRDSCCHKVRRAMVRVVTVTLKPAGFLSQPSSLHFNHAQFGCDGLCVLRLHVMRGFIC